MDLENGAVDPADAEGPTASNDSTCCSWLTLPCAREGRGSRCLRWLCGRWRLSWSVVSVVEIVLMVLTVAYYYFLPKSALEKMLPTNKDDQVNRLSEWVLRMVGNMVCVQIVLLIAGIGWGNTITRKIIYLGMLTGDICLVAVQAAFVHSMSEWNAVNIAIVTMATLFGLFRVITLIFNPSWWRWVKDPNN
ncbi:hypothetical protein ACROYT_G009990 [Oculina patagonica]